MSTLVVELYEVCHGTDISDASPLLIASDITLRAAANALRDQLLQAKATGQLDPTTYPSNKTFYVRPKSGEQTITVTNSTPAAIIAELATSNPNVSVGVYLKIDGAYQLAISPPLSLIRSALNLG